MIPAAGLASRLGSLGYAKELLPITYVADTPGGPLRPMAVIEASLRQLQGAGVNRSVVIISDRKPELVRYLGSGNDMGLDIAFVHQPRADGLAAAASLAGPWLDGGNACLLLPDTVVRPADALKQVRARFESDKADLVLGIFPTTRPLELGPVRFDDAMRVTEVLDKPASTDLANSWAMAIWGPRFTALLAAAVAENPAQTLGSLFHRAACEMTVSACWFPQGQFHDVGTPRGLADALPLFLDGL